MSFWLHLQEYDFAEVDLFNEYTLLIRSEDNLRFISNHRKLKNLQKGGINVNSTVGALVV